MDKRPLITIVTVTYNAAETLPLTMESVAEQTFADFEHLIIDGASTDDTISVARQMGRPDLRIVSEPDHGLYDAMNKGVKLAHGYYLLFLNSGDRFHGADALQAYADAILDKNPDIIYGDTDIVNIEGERIGPRHLSAPEMLTFDSFSNGMLICHQAFMVKKEIAPSYDLQYHFSADYDWAIKCIRNTGPEKCVNLNTVAINYLSDGMTDKNKLKSLKERYRVMANHYGTFSAIKRHIALVLGWR